jgi:chromosome segregation ATPase
MSFKLVNPFSYPLAMTIGGALLFVGSRLVALPSLMVVPLALGSSVAVSYWRQEQEPTPEKMLLRQVQSELEGVRGEAKQLQDQAQTLLNQANLLLRQEQLSPLSMEILAAVQYGCDLAIALPQKVEDLALKLPQTQSLLDRDTLQQKLKKVRSEKLKASGSTLQSLERLEESLERNLNLMNTNQNDRQSQIHNLSALIEELAGVLQRLQNHLQTANLADLNQIDQLQALVTEMNQLQQETDLFV